MGTVPVPITDMGSAESSFATIGWRLEGLVDFPHGATTAGSAYTLEKRADLDGNGVPQLWGVARPGPDGAVISRAASAAAASGKPQRARAVCF